MNNMESMKDWLVTKSNQILGGKETGSSFIRVVTPNNIPEFTIPGYGAAAAKAPGSTDSSLDGGEVAGGSASLPCSATTSPRLSPRVHSPSLSLPSQTTSKSAPVSPCKSPLPRLDSSAAQSSSALHVHGAQTNADPQAMAAISLPHFRKKTSYGFVTVSQSPHTRRKESLFHDADISPTNSPLIRKFSGKSFSDFTGDKVNLTRRASRRRNVQSVVAPLGVIPIPHGGAGKSEESPLSSPGLASPSSNSSPGGTPETVHRDLFEEKVENGLTRKSSRRNRMYYRRRSSLHGLDAAQGGEDGNDDSETSPDPSPGIRRRSNGTIMPVEVGWLKRKSAPAFMEGAHLHKPLVVKSFSCADDLAICKTDQFEINKLHAKLIAEEGELKLSMRYLPEKHSLRVVLLKAENLGGPNRSDQSINAFVRMCLMPGKVQKQTSSIIKHTKDPMFNEDFYFSDLTLEQLKTMKLRLKVLHKSHNLKRTEFLGEIQMPLNELDLLHERRMWKDLQPRIETEELGYLHVNVKFEPKAERLLIHIIEAKDLPRHNLTGPPDPYVKVEVTQPGRPEVKKTTRMRKSSVHPVFKESFLFIISPKIEDLNYTAVTLTVYDHARLRTDDVIGQVRLGYGATEDTEFEHWNQALQYPAKDFQRWHRLMEIEGEN